MAEVGQVSAMINVRVTQYHGIHGTRIEGEVAVPRDGFFAMALEQSAFPQQPLVVHLEQKHRTRSRARGAVEMDFH
jgi:hypothetical protein